MTDNLTDRQKEWLFFPAVLVGLIVLVVAIKTQPTAQRVAVSEQQGKGVRS